MSRDDKDAAKAEPVSEGDREKRAAPDKQDKPDSPAKQDAAEPEAHAPNAYDPDAAERNSWELDAIDACEQKPAWQSDPDAGLAYASCGTIGETTADAPAPSDAPASDAPASGTSDAAPADSVSAEVESGESRSVESVIAAAVLPDYEPDGSDTPPAASQDAGQEASQDGSDTPPPDAPLPPDDAAAAASPETAVVSAPPRDLSEAVDRASKEGEAAAEGGRSMTLLDHLSELRVRLVRSLIALTVGFFACYGFAEELFNYLMIPLTRALPSGAKLIYTALPEAFFVYMQVALVAGAFLASPYLFYQIWAFIAPGLYDDEKRHVIPIAGASALFFVAGAAFCYFQVFPYAFEFFVGFATDTIAPMPKLDEYLGFTLKMLLAFGLIFEMPLFAFFLARLGLVTAQWMRKTRKYAILAIFIVAAILTPPDVFSQLMMAAPMLVLYEISIIVAAVFGKKKPGADSEDGEDAEEKDGEAAKPGPDTIVQGD
ncbi:twin-arginine translocase subunit TatC [Nitratidesulfovibrio sp. SRB-5]|uniref:twin-arginine translocase subunit TatC n=1 Tax=Nitratidesulfovibrio sp. SRB-5 TaxID=2872636 RepID=UPI001CBA69F7|nr:twin-arginine translocase subunit TatC [Nitratidesulfovibrio sp. SRB-5]